MLPEGGGLVPPLFSQEGSNQMDNTFHGGRVKIANSIIEKVVREAAMEVAGVADVGPGYDFVPYDRFTTTESNKGIKLATRDGQIRTDVRLAVSHAEDITKVAESVQLKVVEKLQAITGLRVVEVNIYVEGLNG